MLDSCSWLQEILKDLQVFCEVSGVCNGDSVCRFERWLGFLVCWFFGLVFSLLVCILSPLFLVKQWLLYYGNKGEKWGEI